MSELAGVMPHDEPAGPAHAESRSVKAKMMYFTIAFLVYGWFIAVTDCIQCRQW
ncbi:hypothetical protein AIT68_005003 [Salmonella enterica subsp. salamae]|uniref:hypothetical protein n=1 Tax=Salmonella enterica TaxID=28901 RepID=UPI0012B87E42|nr:hypothetical protein [Salmonella enterica]